MYPRLTIDLNKIYENSKIVQEMCNKSGIQITGVVKGCGGKKEVVDALIESGLQSFGSSRINQLKRITMACEACETLLLRLPQLHEVESVIEYADASLNSERSVLELLSQVARDKDKIHKVILMVDLGDLREGTWHMDELMDLVRFVEDSDSLYLYGLGTNLGCYGSIKPTVENMNDLVEKAELIESIIDRKLEIISGGATTSLPLVNQGLMPERINHLRIGEGILLSRDLVEYFNMDMPGIHMDGFLLEAQIIEIKDKPSYPIGEHFVDAFGNKPMYVDRGIRKRAILACGRQDFGDFTKLICKDQTCKLMGASSDHLIVDITDCDASYEVGNVISFELYYQAMLYLSLCDDVIKHYIK